MSPRPTANSFTSAEAIFAILDAIEARGTLTVRRVMADAPCSERQARDYLAFLEQRGLLTKARRGRTDEYHRPAHGSARGVGAFTRAVGTEFAVAVLGALRGTAFHEGALAHVVGLREELGAVESVRAARLRSAFYAVRGSVPINPEHAEHAEVILDALTHGHKLQGTYELVSTGKIKKYVLRPLVMIVHHHEGLHLLALREDGKVRTFDVEGFRALERIRSKPTPPPDLRVDEYFSGAFGRYTDFPIQDVELRLRGLPAREIARRSVHPSQRLVPEAEGEVTVHLRVGVCPELTSWVLGLMPDVVVAAPEALRVELVRRLRDGASRNTQ